MSVNPALKKALCLATKYLFLLLSFVVQDIAKASPNYFSTMAPTKIVNEPALITSIRDS